MGIHDSIVFEELQRRLAIGFNDQLSLRGRQGLVAEGESLSAIRRGNEDFRLYESETDDVLAWLLQSPRHSIIWYGEKGFPSFTPMCRHLPYMIFCDGKRPDTQRLCAVMVGTRHATYNAIQQSFRLGFESSLNGISVVSGFAEGIDQGAMRGCLEGDSPCIGVLACGHDVDYPSLTADLREDIVEKGGCVLSRFAPRAIPFKSCFLSRNAIMAAYASFCVAVQAPDRSGTMSTCQYVSQMGKNVYVASEGIGELYCQAGTSRLFDEGASAITSMKDVVETEGRLDMGVAEIPFELERVRDTPLRIVRCGDRMYMAIDRKN